MHTFLSYRAEGKHLVLEGGELKHFRVRRIGRGEKFRVIYEGKSFLCQLYSEDREKVLCSVIEELDEKQSFCSITLFQCVPLELKTFDVIVRFATELGVAEVVPVMSSRSFRKREALERKFGRWNSLIKEAMKLSGRVHPLRISEPIDIKEVEPVAEENILLDNFHEGISINEVRKSVKSYSLVVGPEGGFKLEESKALIEKGFKPVYLKPWVMRTQTATLVACGFLINASSS